jgi:hypothetical protein
VFQGIEQREYREEEAARLMIMMISSLGSDSGETDRAVMSA